MTPLLRILLLSAIALAWLAAAPALAEDATADLTALAASGVRLDVFSDLSPLAINRIHSWRIRLRDGAGRPYAAHRLEVSGGMPEHDHGLPTVPAASPTGNPGEFLLEGMRFHMPGRWLFEFILSGPLGTETLSAELQL